MSVSFSCALVHLQATRLRRGHRLRASKLDACADAPGLTVTGFPLCLAASPSPAPRAMWRCAPAYMFVRMNSERALRSSRNKTNLRIRLLFPSSFPGSAIRMAGAAHPLAQPPPPLVEWSDDVLNAIFCRVPFLSHGAARAVCRRTRTLLSSPAFRKQGAPRVGIRRERSRRRGWAPR